MRTVNEVSRLTGVSVRALHHYDAIGLLKPTEITEAGYRQYDDAALARLQSILLFRELQFPLKEIGTILDSPDFDAGEALAQQIRLLELRRKHLDELIAFAREIERGGIDKMSFQAFQKDEIDQYEKEVRERWGTTRAYEEYRQKTAGKTKEELGASGERLLALLAEIGGLRPSLPDETAVQEKVRELQAFITEHYYTCTDEIFMGLGEMYAGDGRMKRNIDGAGGEGTAEFVRQAVSVYCKAKALNGKSPCE